MLRLQTVAAASALALLAATLGGCERTSSTTAAPEAAPAAPAAAKPTKSGYLAVNGVNYHYQVYGEGPPLLLLHGGLGSTDMFQPMLPILTAERQVIGVDLQGHGRTALGERPFSLPAMGADMAQILTQLGHQKVDVMGYSMGGGVAFQLAAQHPDRVNRLVLVSAGYAQDGFYPEMLPQQAALNAQAAEGMKQTPMYTSYVAVAPKPDDFPRLLDTMGQHMRTPYDWSAEVPKLTMPVMLIYGDADMYRPEHEVKFYQLLGGGLRDAGWQRETMSKNRLAILPGQTHYDIFLAPELYQTALKFFEGEGGQADWADTAKAPARGS